MGGGGNHLRWLLLLDPQFSYLREYASDNYSFIINCVYPNDRTWQNWLNYEWRWRLEVENLIAFSHGRVIQSDTRYCALRTDPDNAFRHYLKFNTNLNTTLIDTFKQQTADYNKLINTNSDSANLLIVDSESMFQPTLDQDFYNKVIDWFELSDHYEQAAEIHQQWWKLVKRAEQEIIRDLQGLYS
jgi:hypothetical protein